MPSSGAEERVYQLAVKPGYLRIDSDGRVWRVRRRDGRCCGVRTRAESRAKARGTKDVRWQVKRAGKRVECHATTAVRLVWLHFFGPIPPGMVVLSRDARGVSQRPEDLELRPASARAAHKHRVTPGTAPRGERNPTAVLDESRVVAMRIARAEGRTIRDLSREYGVTDTNVSRICRGENWAHVGGPRCMGHVLSRTKFRIEPAFTQVRSDGAGAERSVA